MANTSEALKRYQASQMASVLTRGELREQMRQAMNEVRASEVKKWRPLSVERARHEANRALIRVLIERHGDRDDGDVVDYLYTQAKTPPDREQP